jgi:hypothetical protein
MGFLASGLLLKTAFLGIFSIRRVLAYQMDARNHVFWSP